MIAVSGCSDNEASSDKENSEKVEETEKESNQLERSDGDIQDFVLENTKIVKILSINQRINQKTPDLGPFQVVRGIDERGQKSEIWIKDMKIYEIINSGSNQTTANNTETEDHTVSRAN